MVMNEEVLERACLNRKLLSTIRNRQEQFFGQCMRRKGMEHLLTTGKIDGQESSGRSR